MKKINLALALLCIVAAASLQFSKPDYVASADQVEAYSKAFAPSKKEFAITNCCYAGFVMGHGLKCVTGTTSCEGKSCPFGTSECSTIYL